MLVQARGAELRREWVPDALEKPRVCMAAQLLLPRTVELTSPLPALQARLTQKGGALTGRDRQHRQGWGALGYSSGYWWRGC